MKKWIEKDYSFKAMVIAVGVSVLVTLGFSKYVLFKEKKVDIVGPWYNTYANQTFLLDLKSDNTFEFGYEGSETTKGKYEATSDVIKLISDDGSENIVYSRGNGYIEIGSSRYYSSKEESKDNDAFYYVPADYDTSMFTELSAEEMIKKYENGEEAFILTARGSCGYCQQFRPIAAESVKKYDYTLYYVDITKITDEQYSTIRALDEKLSSFGSTPNVYYFKGKAVKDVQEGYAEAETYYSFLEQNGVKAKKK